jgi:hypothetical protein
MKRAIVLHKLVHFKVETSTALHQPFEHKPLSYVIITKIECHLSDEQHYTLSTNVCYSKYK